MSCALAAIVHVQRQYSRAPAVHMATYYWLLQIVRQMEKLLPANWNGLQSNSAVRPLIFFYCFIFFLLKNIVYINFLKGLYGMWWVQNKYLI